MSNITLFSQIISKLDRGKFSKLIKDKQSDKHSKGFNSWTHLVSMLFCQFAKSQSVRDISNGLRSATGNLNHLGIGKAPSKSTISYQNKHRPWGLFKEYYFSLLESLGQQARFKQVKFRIKSKIFLLDSTTIGLCLSLFDWATVWDDVNGQVIEIITNQMSWTANTIGELYKSRWQIEIFFRKIKQLLHIKTFIGTTENAVMIQIWAALITILVLKALRAMAKFNWHLSNLVAFIRLNIFVKINLQEWLDKPFDEPPEPSPYFSIQGDLF